MIFTFSAKPWVCDTYENACEVMKGAKDKNGEYLFFWNEQSPQYLMYGIDPETNEPHKDNILMYSWTTMLFGLRQKRIELISKLIDEKKIVYAYYCVDENSENDILIYQYLIETEGE